GRGGRGALFGRWWAGGARRAAPRGWRGRADAGAWTAAARRVVLLDDCFTTFQEPQIGRAAVELLERAGFAVELASVCCGRAMISKGFLTDARRLAEEGVAKLDRYAAA